jgi:predicted nucleic-acid-binding Zn-ribbon protein
MADIPKCLKCGGTDLKAGQLAGAFLPVSAFRPEGGSGLSYKKHTMPIKATMCLDCGFVELAGDPKSAKTIIKNIETDR